MTSRLLDVGFDNLCRTFDAGSLGVNQKIVLVTSTPLVVGVELVVLATLLVYRLDLLEKCSI